MKKLFLSFVIAFTLANIIVKYCGAYGLLISSFLLIPFDFVVRCVLHERYKGAALVWLLFGLTCIASAITMLVNADAKNIALASLAGFAVAQIVAGLYYQAIKTQASFFQKVNGSDVLAIIADSIIFQLVAFGSFTIGVAFGQIVIKIVGGLLWYYIIFKKLRLHERIK